MAIKARDCMRTYRRGSKEKAWEMMSNARGREGFLVTPLVSEGRRRSTSSTSLRSTRRRGADPLHQGVRGVGHGSIYVVSQ